jgi:cytochrome c peroxidase
MENPIEMGSSRLFVAHHIFAEYKVGYEAVFGALPPLTDGARFPPAGKPGEPAFDGMAEADREAVTTVFVNAAKSIAAFERGLRARPSRFDAYLDGDERALTAEEKDGIVAFFQAGCSQCHHGPRLTDDGFHSLRFPSHSLAADEGRLGAFGVMKRSPFRADGPYSDAPRGDRRVARARPGRWGRGAFKTPSLRGTAATGPWGHAGTLPSLDDVLRVYGRRGMPMDRALDGGPDSGLGGEPLPDGLAVGETEPWVPEFHDAARGPIEAFLRTLTADPADDRESLRGPPQR